MSGAMLAPPAVAALMERFPVDRVTVEETLALCDGDADRCATTLAEVLAEEAAAQPPSMLHTLFDSVSLLARLPRADQPADQRDRILMLCASLEVNGVRLLRPVTLILDGSRDGAAVTAGLDEADRVVALKLLALIEEDSGGTVDGLTATERQMLTDQFATADERQQTRELERLLAENSSTLATKEAELKALKMKVIKHRMANTSPTGQ